MSDAAEPLATTSVTIVHPDGTRVPHTVPAAAWADGAAAIHALLGTNHTWWMPCPDDVCVVIFDAVTFPDQINAWATAHCRPYLQMDATVAGPVALLPYASPLCPASLTRPPADS